MDDGACRPAVVTTCEVVLRHVMWWVRGCGGVLQVLLGADGQPEALFNGVVDAATGFSHTIAVPLQAPD